MARQSQGPGHRLHHVVTEGHSHPVSHDPGENERGQKGQSQAALHPDRHSRCREDLDPARIGTPRAPRGARSGHRRHRSGDPRCVDRHWEQTSFIDDILGVQRERQPAPATAGSGAQLYDRSPICTLALAAVSQCRRPWSQRSNASAANASTNARCSSSARHLLLRYSRGPPGASIRL